MRTYRLEMKLKQILSITSYELIIKMILESHTTPSPENGNCSRRSVKDVIPESRLAQYYGNFYYDEVRLIH